MAIGRKTSNLLGMLKQHDTSDSAAGAVTEALRVLQEAMPDRIAIMSGRELEEIDRAMDDAIRDLEDLPPSK
jgi:trehalose-6-phosphatase